MKICPTCEGEGIEVLRDDHDSCVIACRDCQKVEGYDPINHPPHYLIGGIEVIDFIEAKGFNYRVGNAVKYISRHKMKGKPIEDLKKAVWYLEREIEALEEDVEES